MPLMAYYGFRDMSWNIGFTGEFESWFKDIDEAAQNDTQVIIRLLEDIGPRLPFPHSSGIENSRHSHMRELRIQSKGRPIRVFYAFDPVRSAILLIGGDKTGDKRFYKTYIPIADKLYDGHLAELREKGDIK